MIPVKDLLSAQREVHTEAADLAPLSDDDLTKLDYLDERVESGSTAREVFDIRIPPDFCSPEVVAALKHRYESGGWSVGIFRHYVGDVLAEVQVVFSATRLSTAERTGSASRSLPKLSAQAAPTAPLSRAGEKRLLVRMPTRSRPVQALEVLSAYREKAGVPISMEVILDDNDEAMLAPTVLQRLNALGCTITVIPPGGKIAAVNAGVVTDWDILVLASDDMVPVVYGYAAEILRAMEHHFPHGDGAVYFDDGVCGDKLCTLPIFGRRLHDAFGYIYDSSYLSLCSDTEQTELLRAMGRLAYVDKKIIEHQHPVVQRFVERKDALYATNDALHDRDKATFDKRKATVRPYAQFGFDSPPLWLSICIATTAARRARLDRLLEHLYRQVMRHARQVEILVDSVEGLAIGTKRDRLLGRARGHFVAFIDDDDWVVHDYVDRILGAITREPEADCVGLVGVMTTNGERPETFVHSLAYDRWYSEGGVHYRSPNHLNPVRRSLAVETGFADMEAAEDHDYSKRLQPRLSKEASPGSAPLYYYWCMTTKSGLGA